MEVGLRLTGLGLPFTFENRPHALHSRPPLPSLLHSGVSVVWQLQQMGTVSLPERLVGGDSFLILVAELYDDVGEERAYAGLLVDIGIE